MVFSARLVNSLLMCICFGSTAVYAQEALIRKNLAARAPQFQNIDQISKTAIAGMYEIRVNGTDIVYSDAKGDFIFQGVLIDTKKMQNVTKDRIEKLLTVKFDDLPLHDAITIVKGDGKRKLAVFEDPLCGFCKRFERDLQKIDNVSIYVFLYPVLGLESVEKSRAIWCSKDPGNAWSDWMQKDVVPIAKADPCNSAAVNRNLNFGHSYKIEGTPTMILADGTRVPGAIEAKKLEALLNAQDTKVR